MYSSLKTLKDIEAKNRIDNELYKRIIMSEGGGLKVTIDGEETIPGIIYTEDLRQVAREWVESYEYNRIGNEYDLLIDWIRMFFNLEDDKDG